MGAKRLYRDLTLNGLARSSLLPRALRFRLLRALGMDIPGWTAIMPGCWFGGTDVHIGDGTTVNYGVFFDTAAPITIGERCDIGMEAMLCTSTHEKGGPDRRAGKAGGAPIVIEDGVWIGTRALIMPGVRVGSGCIIAAGAVVTSDCEPHRVYAGVPATAKSSLPEAG
ncbi:acyltransferase [Aeromicrobium duanguangcaii]|uniref:Acyltransferase n=1 Tax=Aeromicrobium duanguangcaii TaxID=2968086 RepID=A0ABY5KHB2_9ACTN|nr:acyltransferase [Aeromicrobium duanguangcaii]MCD9154519.1 acyltransferase [Aeromicrobium duanguangcaii]MCL3838267.1 acyltransferase [Aeromicrobium duanguangcaii]UUI68425.1 acyltransferase [Aeromicrobium duanguangcaii]